jgi:ribosomal protein L7/L12
MEDLKQQVRALLANRQKIPAIKLFRERTGVGIKQAKEAVEAIGRGEPVSIPETVEVSFEEQLVRLLDQGQ